MSYAILVYYLLIKLKIETRKVRSFLFRLCGQSLSSQYNSV